ncbi:O-antigen ligase family protein [uncultured Psychroserpens sp.]|uniref:O-antigen ligase family protein n=1 Tax=uncultured Psychroserpens sp. TaxID=255436 RepID=UPI00261C4D77|nr:O-antigen ligase family protein [uncultured Psychroserpens sp.]
MPNNNTKTATFLLKLFLIINSAIILVPDKFKGIPVIGLLLSAIFYFIVNKSDKNLNLKLFRVSTSFFLVLLISISYSENTSYAFRKLETGLSLLAYPLVFMLLYNCKEKLDKKLIETLKWVFVIALTVFLISTFTYYFLTEPHYTFKSTIIHYHTLVDLRIIGYEIHSIYLSMHIGVGILFLINSMSNTQKTKILYHLFLLVLFFVFLAILNKRGPIIALGIIGIIYLIRSKIKTKAFIYVSALTAVFVLTMLFIPKFNNINRFKELIDIEGLRTNPNSSTALRLSIYNCAYKQAIKSPIIGYGWGDVKGVLDDCYQDENPNLLLKNYNTHNQFLSILLSTGIIGLAVFLFYFYYLFKFSNKNRNRLLFFLLLYFGLNMLSENILEREDGVIFFSFFINLFLFNSEKNTDKITEEL